MLTPEQFGHNLKIFLGKTTDRSTVTMVEFHEAINQI